MPRPRSRQELDHELRARKTDRYAAVAETAAWIFGLCGTLYGLRQQKLRRDTIQTQSGRIIELETRHDPERSSSKLSERGTTHAEDLRR
jgi:hypothetical protein